MRIVKATLVTILFLLIPHQAPFAGPSDGNGQEVLGDQVGSALPRTASESSAVQIEPAHREAIPSNEGFVWSVASSRSPGTAWNSSSDLLETDGYSWSARSAESKPAADATP